LVLPAPGSSILTGVSSACSTAALSTDALCASYSGSSSAPAAPAHAANVARGVHARARVDLFLAVVRDVVDEAANQRVCDQPRRRDALVDDLRIHRLQQQDLAALAGPLAAHMTVHEEPAGTISTRSLTSSPIRTTGRPQAGVG
jgi:hypothetical protein